MMGEASLSLDTEVRRLNLAYQRALDVLHAIVCPRRKCPSPRRNHALRATKCMIGDLGMIDPALPGDRAEFQRSFALNPRESLRRAVGNVVLQQAPLLFLKEQMIL